MSKGSRRRSALIDAETESQNWIRIFGVTCPHCKGTGDEMIEKHLCDCSVCNGIGKIRKHEWNKR